MVLVIMHFILTGKENQTIDRFFFNNFYLKWRVSKSPVVRRSNLLL